MAEPLLRQKSIPEHIRILEICDTINLHQLTPKKFFLALLTNSNEKVVDRRKKWPASGLSSTMELLRVLIDLVKKNNKGKEMWRDLVLSEVSSFVYHSLHSINN
jgi:hypothetical protein